MKKGFTLTELLVALTIIGVIFVIATPRLISNIDKKTKVTALQRAHLAINEAVSALMLDERAKNIKLTSLYADEESYDMQKHISDFLKKYIKIKKDCGIEVSECLAPSYKNIVGKSVSVPGNSDAYCAVASTNFVICLKNAYEDSPAIVWLDTNGKQGPNISGRDFFRFFIYDEGVITDGLSSTGTDSSMDPEFGNITIVPSACLSNTNGGGCLTRIIKSDWVMDY